ncbi:MAG: hypothetical protein WB952_17880 [Terriglobales bacterium]
MFGLCHKASKLTAVWVLAVLLIQALPVASDAKGRGGEILRWTEGEPGCTFSADDDGKYRYSLWTTDFGITIAVDGQEMQKAIRRIQPLFAVWLTVHYRGATSAAVRPELISLEFVKHEHDVQQSLDPENLVTKLQSEADAFAKTTQREIRKHPEKQSGKESDLQSHLHDVEETQDFLRTHGLHSATLDRAHPDASGWVFFNARSKWVGDWKTQEEFVLRVPMGERTIEFPFALPPSEGDLLLRRRPAN